MKRTKPIALLFILIPLAALTAPAAKTVAGTITGLVTQNGGTYANLPPGALLINAPMGAHAELDLRNGATTSGITSILIVGETQFGKLLVREGSTATSDGGRIGGWSDGGTGNGTVIVTGSGSLWENSRSLYVGAQGVGNLDIRAGGIVMNQVSGILGHNSTGEGTVDVDGNGSEWITDGNIHVGLYGEGTLNVTNGAAVCSTVDIYVGTYDGVDFLGGTGRGDGAINVSGGVLESANRLSVGAAGSGSLRVERGGVVYNWRGGLGTVAGGHGEATVTGDGSRWFNYGSLDIGKSGTGDLAIEDGGAVSSGDSSLGLYSGSAGTATITGDGSSWGAGELTIGDSGEGTILIDAGATVSNTTATLGQDASSIGSAVVQGTGSVWTNRGSIVVGDQGSGTIRIENGGAVASIGGFTGSRIGDASGSTGSVFVTGAGSRWDDEGGILIGVSGQGNLSIIDSAQVATGSDAALGLASGALGNAIVSGDASKWDVAGSLVVADRGDALVRIENGGQLVTGGPLAIISNRGGQGEVVVRGETSKWSHNADVQIGPNDPANAVDARIDLFEGAAFEVGGGVTVQNDGSLNLFGNSLAEINGDMTVSMGGSFTLSGNTTADIRGRLELIGNGGRATTTLLNNATLIVDELKDIGHVNFKSVGPDTTVRLNRWTSTDPVTFGYAQLNGNLQIGHSGGSGGTDPEGIQIDGGELQVGNNLVVGYDAAATVLVKGSSVSSLSTSIAKHDNSTGTVTVQDGSTWTTEETLFVGGDAAHDGGTARLDILRGGRAIVGEKLHLGPNGTLQVNDFDSRVLVGPSPWDLGRQETVVVYKEGELSGAGTIAADLVNHGLITPGGSAGSNTGILTVQGDYFQNQGNSLQDHGMLQIELGGLLPGEEYDQLAVEGSVLLEGGTLAVTLIDGFDPKEGDMFSVLTATGGIEENYWAFQLPVLAPGLGWLFPGYDLESSTSLTLSVVSVDFIPGDFDEDGDVDGNDLMKWQRGESPNPQSAWDFASWQAYYGRKTPLFGNSTNVPEPSTCLLVLVGTLMGLSWRQTFHATA